MCSGQTGGRVTALVALWRFQGQRGWHCLLGVVEHPEGESSGRLRVRGWHQVVHSPHLSLTAPGAESSPATWGGCGKAEYKTYGKNEIRELYKKIAFRKMKNMENNLWDLAWSRSYGYCLSCASGNLWQRSEVWDNFSSTVANQYQVGALALFSF